MGVTTALIGNCGVTFAPVRPGDAARLAGMMETVEDIPADAPAEDEIIIALGASVGGHPNHRIGDRYKDLEEMGHSLDNPAGV